MQPCDQYNSKTKVKRLYRRNYSLMGLFLHFRIKVKYETTK